MVIVTSEGKFRTYKAILKMMEDNRIGDIYVDYMKGYVEYKVAKWMNIDEIRELSKIKPYRQ